MKFYFKKNATSYHYGYIFAVVMLIKSFDAYKQTDI